jgi:UDPglucose--hexose-1-phosphate uridylyltransferase
VPVASSVSYDPDCYLCPGNARANGERNPEYEGIYVFENDFAALRMGRHVGEIDFERAGLLRATSEGGICRVLCFDPRHDLTLATMSREGTLRVVEEWVSQEAELAARSDIAYVQIFENRGALMGSSNPHPHGQIWATEHIPNEPLLELASQREYFKKDGPTMLLDYLQLEVRLRERLVAENASWVAVVPFWAVWPFELLLIPKQRARNLQELNSAAREGLAEILKLVTGGYDEVFAAPFAYSMGFHSAPCDDASYPEWQLHVHFYPPLLRSASIRKFMVGFELLGSPQRDITPEAAATVLRNSMGAFQDSEAELRIDG